MMTDKDYEDHSMMPIVVGIFVVAGFLSTCTPASPLHPSQPDPDKCIVTDIVEC